MGIAKDKLTDEQKREVERLRQFVSRNKFNVLMNSTKWRAAIDAGQPPDEVAISAVTLGELAAGVRLVVGDDEESRAERDLYEALRGRKGGAGKAS